MYKYFSGGLKANPAKPASARREEVEKEPTLLQVRTFVHERAGRGQGGFSGLGSKV